MYIDFTIIIKIFKYQIARQFTIFSSFRFLISSPGTQNNISIERINRLSFPNNGMAAAKYILPANKMYNFIPVHGYSEACIPPKISSLYINRIQRKFN